MSESTEWFLNSQSTRQIVGHVYNMLLEIRKEINLITNIGITSSLDLVNVEKINNIIIAHIIKMTLNSNRLKRIAHFMLYINTDFHNYNFIQLIKPHILQNYIISSPIPTIIYLKLVEMMYLKPFITELIMNTSYCFCNHLIDIYYNEISKMEPCTRLKHTEELITAVLKSIKYKQVNVSLYNSFINNFTQITSIYMKDYIHNDDIKALNPLLLKEFEGLRIRSIFKISVEVIKHNNTYTRYPMYELQSLDTHYQLINVEHLYLEFFDSILNLCIDLSIFSMDDWIFWYKIEVDEDDTNLQTAIGHLCYELNCFIDNGTIIKKSIQQFMPKYINIMIKKIDFTNIDTTNVEVMIDHVEKSSRCQLNEWIKKMIENSDIFINPRAILSLDNSVEIMDNNCFKHVVNRCMIYYKNGGKVLETMGDMLYKGIKKLDLLEKIYFLRYVIKNHSDNAFYFSNDFDDTLHFVVITNFKNHNDQNELISKLIWLVIQQPKKLFHILVSCFITGVFGLPPISEKKHLYGTLIEIHRNIDKRCIYDEYNTWLDNSSNLSLCEQDALYNWIYNDIYTLNIIKPINFLVKILIPKLNLSPNYEHLQLLVNLTKFFINEAKLELFPKICLWGTLLIQLAKILDNTRWTVDNFSYVRVKLCEDIIVAIQPLLNYVPYIAGQRELDNIKKVISDMHLMTQSHFNNLLSNHYTSIDGMNEKFIMTVKSQSHITYSNLNSASSQREQQEFIFSIATIMPRLTMNELNSFVSNYLSSVKPQDIIEASYFFLDCIMNAFMRIIMYIKTTIINESHWAYLENACINLITTITETQLCNIYNKDINIDTAIYGLTKIIMVTKQLDNKFQDSLLAIIGRITEVLLMKKKLNNDYKSKLILLISSVKSKNCKEKLKYIVDALYCNT